MMCGVDYTEEHLETANKETARRLYIGTFKYKHPIIYFLFSWMMNFYGPCVGFTLFKRGRRKVELFICPPNYTIPKHSHDDQDIELAFLYGRAFFFIQYADGKGRSAHVHGFGNPFKTFSVPAGCVHWFSVTSRKLIFLNYSKWKDGVKVTSAATDFHLAKES